jgi:diacylglycerol kinase
MLDDNPHSPERSWSEKFRDAFRGVKLGVRGQSSFFVHFFFAVAVIVAAIVLGVSDYREWCLLILCIAGVLAAEMFNSAMELLARCISDQPDARLGRALDIGSAAVLIASVGAAVVGLIIFGRHLMELIR